MSEQNPTAGQGPRGAAPGIVDTPSADLGRAVGASTDARRAVTDEERRARVDSSVEQQRRVENARRDLDAAEAFEESLDDGQL